MAIMEPTRKMRETVVAPKMQSREQTVEFSYNAPSAKKVCLAGKFNAWNTSSLPMKKDKNGTWRISIKLQPGQHEYKFFVDGVWAQNMTCSDKVLNPFGTYNCIMGVQ